MLVTINDIPVQTAKGSVSIENTIEERSTCSFVVVDIRGVAHYSKGDIVRISNDVDDIIFEGEVETSKENRIAGTGLYHSIECVDWNSIADRRYIAKTYSNRYAGDIVKDIVNTYLRSEGVTYNDTTTYYPDMTPVFNISSNTDLQYNADGSLSLKKGAESEVFTNNVTTSSVTSNVLNIARAFDGNASTYAQVSDAGATKDTFEMTINGTERNISKLRLTSGGANYPINWRIWYQDMTSLEWILVDDKTYTRTSTDNPFSKNGYVYTLVLPNVVTTKKFKFEFGTNISSSTPIIMYSIEGFVDGNTLSNSGTTTSALMPLDSIGVNKGSVIEWTQKTPTGTSVIVEVSIDNGQTWRMISSGNSASTLYGGEELYGMNLLLRVSLSTINSAFAPSISNIKVKWIDVPASLQQGELIEEATFNYIPISEAIGKLAEQTGFWWDIAPSKVARFAERSMNVAPFKINKMSIIKDSLSVEIGNSSYRNQQYIIGAKDITDVQTESFKGDGIQKTFVVGYKLAKVPSVYVNNVKVDRMGIKGVSDDSYEWFWSKGDASIYQRDDAVALTSTQTLKVEYQGEFDIVVVSKDDDEIARRRNKVGGTGLIEHVDEDHSIQSKSQGFELANKKLEKFGKIGKKVAFSTWKHGLEVGQLVTIDFPIHEINNQQFLIQSISINYEGGETSYQVEAVHNLSEGSWAKFFYDLYTKGRTHVIRENIGDDQILITREEFSKTWLETDNPNIYKVLFPTLTTFPTSTTYPMFKAEDRVKYVSFFRNDREVFRKPIAKLTESADGRVITTTSSIQAREGNGVITHVAWFGGHTADENFGTGIMLDIKPYNKEKTNLESIQIDKIDTKGW